MGKSALMNYLANNSYMGLSIFLSGEQVKIPTIKIEKEVQSFVPICE